MSFSNTASFCVRRLSWLDDVRRSVLLLLPTNDVDWRLSKLVSDGFALFVNVVGSNGRGVVFVG